MIDVVCRPKMKQTHRIDVLFRTKCDGAQINLIDARDKVFAQVHITQDALTQMIDELRAVEAAAGLFRTVRGNAPRRFITDQKGNDHDSVRGKP